MDDSYPDFKTVINSWEDKQMLADELGVPSGTVLNWYYRNRIPVEYWLDVLYYSGQRDLGWQAIDFVEMANDNPRKTINE